MPLNLLNKVINKLFNNNKQWQSLQFILKDMVYKIIAISGSLSKSSANSGLLRACLLVKHPELQIQIVDVSKFPLFNMDPVIEVGFPPQVKQVRDKIANAQAVLFATPEHNWKVSAVLKNAYDWISFTTNLQVAPPIKQIPAAVMSASRTGGERAQEHFRRICNYCKLKVMQRGLQIKKDEGDFDQSGNVKSQNILKKIEEFLKQFAVFVGQNKTR